MSTWNRSKMLSGPTIGAIYLRHGGRCAYCGRAVPLRGSEFDHIRPRSAEWAGRSDRDSPRNLALSCAGCNQRKAQGLVPKADIAAAKRAARKPLDLRAGRNLVEAEYPWRRDARERRNELVRLKRAAASLTL